jgi:hypothetical protein
MGKQREQPERRDTWPSSMVRTSYYEPDRSDTGVLERPDVDLESTARYKSTTPPDGRR